MADRDQPGLTAVDHGELRPSVDDRDLSQYTMTIDEALVLFERAGLPRNKRTVERYCEHNQIDAVKLVAAFGPTWYLNSESVYGKIKKLQQFEDIKRQHATIATSPDALAVEPDMSRQFNTPTDPVSQPDVPSEKQVELLEEFKRLKQENVELKIDNRGLVETVRVLVEQSKEDAKERRELAIERKTWMAQIGEMTARMLQLTSGGYRTPPPPVPAEVIHDRVIEHRTEPATSMPLENH